MSEHPDYIQFRDTLRKVRYSSELQIVQGVFVFALFSFVFTFGCFYWKADIITDQFNKGDAVLSHSLVTADFVAKEPVCAAWEDAGIARGLVAQFEYLGHHKEQYLYTARSYEVLCFACTFIFVYFSVVTGVVAFLVARKGWDTATNPLRTALLVTLFLTTLTGAIPKVFDHEKNTKSNIGKYFLYSNLQLEIYQTLCKTQYEPNDTVRYKLRLAQLENVTQTVKENSNLFIDLSPDLIRTEVTALTEQATKTTGKAP